MKTTCYRYYDSEGRLLYIGITKNLFDRQDSHQRTQDWWTEVSTATFTHFETRDEAFTYEAKMIGIEFPKYNRAGAVLPEESRLHLLSLMTSEFDDEFHAKASGKMSEIMLDMNEFSVAPESYKLLFAFDYAMPSDEAGEQREIDCCNCQKIYDSKWYKDLLIEVNNFICDEAAVAESRSK
jgi:hypothetical protein